MDKFSKVENVRSQVKEFIGNMHPAAKFAWGAVGVILLLGLLFTAYHNVRLYARGLPVGWAQIFALAPALILDGSIALLIVLMLTAFKDGVQWTVAAVFNGVLVFIVGANTILDYQLSTGEMLSDGMLTYLRGGIIGAFLLALVMWEVLIHLDPANRRRKAKGELELRAENALHGFEVAQMEFQIKKQEDELEYERQLHLAMHARRLAAIDSQTVEAALGDFESGEAQEKARRIRSVHGQQTKPTVWRGNQIVSNTGNGLGDWPERDAGKA